jgi:hypothetical protein
MGRETDHSSEKRKKSVTARATPQRSVIPLFVLLALSLLAMTMAWHLPLMLWDHLDLVPIYQAWREGSLTASEFWRIHDGSHLHVSAYTVLLWTTWLSDGRPWLDCLVSWALLTFQAWMILRIALMQTRSRALPQGWWIAILALAFYPGHLANLQWGWQVAVFISLLGAVAPIYCLTRETWRTWANLASVLIAGIGVLSFSTSLVVFPIAMVLIALRSELSLRRRVLEALPWISVLALLLQWLGQIKAAGSIPLPAIDELVGYVLNYLGSGVLRFAENVAPFWTIVALLTCGWAAGCARNKPALRPWLALVVFSVGCAVLTAAGRAGVFGADHAFAQRYVSFSSLFWIGWLGTMLVAFHDAGAVWRRVVRPLLAVTLLFATANAVHLIKKAAVTHARSEQYALNIRTNYPALDAETLRQAYGGRAGAAPARLRALHAWGFAPFTEVPAQPADPPR